MGRSFPGVVSHWLRPMLVNIVLNHIDKISQDLKVPNLTIVVPQFLCGGIGRLVSQGVTFEEKCARCQNLVGIMQVNCINHNYLVQIF